MARLKLQHAADRLLTSGRQVKQVASEIGYADTYYFSRVFRRRFGVSPGRFAHRAYRASTE